MSYGSEKSSGSLSESESSNSLSSSSSASSSSATCNIADLPYLAAVDYTSLGDGPYVWDNMELNWVLDPVTGFMIAEVTGLVDESGNLGNAPFEPVFLTFSAYCFLGEWIIGYDINYDEISTFDMVYIYN